MCIMSTFSIISYYSELNRNFCKLKNILIIISQLLRYSCIVEAQEKFPFVSVTADEGILKLLKVPL